MNSYDYDDDTEPFGQDDYPDGQKSIRHGFPYEDFYPGGGRNEKEYPQTNTPLTLTLITSARHGASSIYDRSFRGNESDDDVDLTQMVPQEDCDLTQLCTRSKRKRETTITSDDDFEDEDGEGGGERAEPHKVQPPDKWKSGERLAPPRGLSTFLTVGEFFSVPPGNFSSRDEDTMFSVEQFEAYLRTNLGARETDLPRNCADLLRAVKDNHRVRQETEKTMVQYRLAVHKQLEDVERLYKEKSDKGRRALEEIETRIAESLVKNHFSRQQLKMDASMAKKKVLDKFSHFLKELGDDSSD